MQPLAFADSDGGELRFHEDISTNMLFMVFFGTPESQILRLESSLRTLRQSFQLARACKVCTAARTSLHTMFVQSSQPVSLLQPRSVSYRAKFQPACSPAPGGSFLAYFGPA